MKKVVRKEEKVTRIVIDEEVRIPVKDDNDIILEIGDIIEVLPKIEEKKSKEVLKKEFHARMKKRIADQKEEEDEKDKDDKKDKDKKDKDDDDKDKDDKDKNDDK